ncbi:MAG: response regulator [Myxococcales bacterium]
MGDGYILVVDDEADQRELMAETLSIMGYEVATAEDGQVALDKMAERIPDLVLLDLRMPRLSGWGVLEAMKKMQRARNVPVLIISGFGFEWEAQLVGAAGYISKPIDIDFLRQKVSRLAGPPREVLLH